MKAAFTVILSIVYAIVGLIQIGATISGLEYFTGWWSWVCFLLGMFVGWMPLVGTGLGIYGAYADWHWSLPAAFGLFLGIPVMFAAIAGLAALAAKVFERR